MTYSWETPSSPSAPNATPQSSAGRWSWERDAAPRGPAADLANAPINGMGDWDNDVFLDNAADSATFGLNNRIGAVIDGAGAALHGGSFSDAYSARVHEALERLRRGGAEHPGSALAGQAAGFLPWMLVPVGGEAAAARVGGGAISQGLRAGGRFFAGDVLPGMRELQTIGRGRGLPAAAAQYGSAAYTGAAYGGLNGITHSEPGQEAQAIIPGALAGGVGGAAFRGVGTVLGAADNVAARTATGAGVGAVVGGGAAALNGQDIAQGAEMGGGIGAGVGALARPTLMGWAERHPAVRVASGAALGGVGAGGYALMHNNDPKNGYDAPINVGDAAIGGAAAGAALGGAGRPAMRLLARMGPEAERIEGQSAIAHTVDNNLFDAGVTTAPSLKRFGNSLRNQVMARRVGQEVPPIRVRDILNGAAPPTFHGASERAHDIADLMHHNVLGIARRNLLGQSRTRNAKQLENFLDQDLRTSEGRRAFQNVMREVRRIEGGRTNRGNYASSYGVGSGGATSWRDLQNQLTGDEETP